MVYDLDWENERFEEWRCVLGQAQDLPPCSRRSSPSMLGTSWPCLQHAPWLGRLLAASIQRQTDLTTEAHLKVVNLGLPSIGAGIATGKLGCSPSPTVFWWGTEIGMKEHDLLAPAIGETRGVCNPRGYPRESAHQLRLGLHSRCAG
ncbi:DUF1612 domain-containing protein [Rhizobium sophoriradicis]|uniref:DUF1612 domain-containing protein n=1 Tax=Rhizobium sophoriradicis TaxID=1535245 RepID=UPI00098F2002|nr:DUF1612 domain-containing protein [Rhizobium sophoriradicis]RSC21001.1 DUF1612 domain-containing protein [Rhizobium sophoriradicis]